MNLSGSRMSSFGLGIAVTVAALALVGMSPQGMTVAQQPLSVRAQVAKAALVGMTTTINGVPTPQQMMRVQEGASFTVPAGKILVATGMGSTGYSAGGSSLYSKRVQVFVDGTPALACLITEYNGGGTYAGAGPAIPAIPPGFVVHEGQTVSVEDPSPADWGVLLGYLVDS